MLTSGAGLAWPGTAPDAAAADWASADGAAAGSDTDPRWEKSGGVEGANTPALPSSPAAAPGAAFTALSTYPAVCIFPGGAWWCSVVLPLRVMVEN